MKQSVDIKKFTDAIAGAVSVKLTGKVTQVMALMVDEETTNG